jgi:WhiB family redox-sensing transcriptional regulator
MTITQDRAGVSGIDSDDASAWRMHSRCVGEDPEIFFKGGGTTAKAKAICAACPVRQECLELGLEHDERFGIWGGLTWAERKALRSRRCAWSGCRQV